MSSHVDRIVKPLYLLLLHGNFLDLEGRERDDFEASFKGAVETVSDEELSRLLRLSWRESLTGAWLAGALRVRSLEEQICSLLLESRTCYAGQGYCLALARFGGERAVGCLVSYLDRYLPVGQREYDQRWAAAALAFLDQRSGRSELDRFMAPSLWEVTASGVVVGELDPQPLIARFATVMAEISELAPD